MPKTFYIFKAEDVYKVVGNTKEDIWVSAPAELTESDPKEEARLKKLIAKWRRESARRARQ